jgi:phosphoribosylanthranilate isomerase
MQQPCGRNCCAHSSRQLYTEQMATKVKICGITSVEDALHAAACGADFLGFVLYPKSPRYLPPERAKQIVDAVAQEFPTIVPVAVVVNEPIDQLLRLSEHSGIRWFQLHGEESPALCAQVRGCGITVIKALRFGAGAPPVAWEEYQVDYFLCDTFDSKQPGGTGRTWETNTLPAGFPLKQSFLAGGLRPTTVSALIRELRPWAVDVSSGVEIRPGLKDRKLVESFISAVRHAESS